MLNNMLKLLSQLHQFLSEDNILLDKISILPYLKEQRGNFNSNCAMVITPTNNEEVSKVLQCCNNLNIEVIPLSGNTGLVGGGVSKNNQVIISLKKLNSLRELDLINQTITLEAGFKLNDALDICNKHNFVFPLDLPSRDTALIGGNLATNAGGLNTIKYGQIKNFTLGLEVVLPNGHIVSDLNKLNKRNIGPDYKNLFIGSEGILGIITAATFKLYPKPKQNISIILSTHNTTNLLETFLIFKENFCWQISAFEIMNNTATKISLNVFNDSFFPINTLEPWYALINLDYYNNSTDNINIVSSLLSKLKNTNKIGEYYIECNTKNLWKFRDLISKAQSIWGPSLKYDIAIPLSNNTIFISKAIQKIHDIAPVALPVIFGHMGDQSLHFNFTTKSCSHPNNKTELINLKPKIDEAILGLVMQYQGSFSAEHGIGLLHPDNVKKYYYNNQYYMLKLLKNSFDPNNILNPNKVIKLT